MKYISPRYLKLFACAGDRCAAPCAAPVDMTWTRTLGEFCETGLSMACPEAARLMLLRPEKVEYVEETVAGAPLSTEHVTPEQLALIMDARKTIDLVLQNRQMPLRSNLVLAIAYCEDFEPLIASGDQYAYEELDWGYTEQPVRQLQDVAQLMGSWELKRSDLCNILWAFHALCREDTVLGRHLQKTLDFFVGLSGENYRLLREQFDAELAEREYLFENLLVYFVHRYFLFSAETRSVTPSIRLMAVTFAVIRAMAARVWQETGILTDEAFVALCWHYARCVEETPEVRSALWEKLQHEPLYGRDRLQRLFWR